MVGYEFLPVRVVTYLEGEVMAKVPQTPQLLEELGSTLGYMDQILQKHLFMEESAKRFIYFFQWSLNPSPTQTYKRKIKWDLMNAESTIEEQLKFVEALENGNKSMSYLVMILHFMYKLCII